MTMEALTLLTFTDGDRRETPVSPVVLTRWEISLLGCALRWPQADLEGRGGHYLAEAAHRFPRGGSPARLPAAPDGDTWTSVAAAHGEDDADSGYWLDAGQVRAIFANLGDPSTRSEILAWAARSQVPDPRPDRLIVCLQMLSQAVRRGMGVHLAHYLC